VVYPCSCHFDNSLFVVLYVIQTDVRNNMKKLIIILVLCFGLFGCGEIKKEDEQQKKEKKRSAALAGKPERMEVIFEHFEGLGIKNYYGLRDKETGREFLVLLTGNYDGGIAVIELNKAENETSNPY